MTFNLEYLNFVDQLVFVGPKKLYGFCLKASENSLAFLESPIVAAKMSYDPDLRCKGCN